MKRQFYATTKDKKGHEHNYRLDAGEGVPAGHEITDLKVAGQFKFSEIIGDEMAAVLREGYKLSKGKRAKA